MNENTATSTKISSLPSTPSGTQPVIQPPEQPASNSNQVSVRRSGRISAKPVLVNYCDEEPVEQPAKKPKLSTESLQPVQKGRKIKYPLKKLFSWNVCRDLSQLYRLAVYQNVDNGPDSQATAVKAVLYHEMDYPEANIDERAEFHQYCGEWCPYKEWENKKKPLSDFKRDKKDIHGNVIRWEGGILANFKNKYPDAFEELLDIFVLLGNPELMSRCTRMITQNINESLHAKLWKNCLK